MTDFAAVLTELRAQRDTLAAQLADVEAGIRVILKLNGGPEAIAPADAPRRKATAQTAPSADDDRSTRILAALRTHGEPMSPGELQDATKLSAYIVSPALDVLRAKRLIVLTGAGRGKRIALPGMPAKEAP